MPVSSTRYHGWSVVAASWLAVFCLFGYRATFAILKDPMAATLGWTASQVTLGYSLMMVLYAATAFVSGLILDRFGTKPVYAIAAVFGGLGFILTSMVDRHLAYLLSFGLLGGVATGMLWVSSTISVRKWYVGRSYASMWGIAFSGAPMAQFILSQLLKPRLGAAQANLDQALRLAGGAGREDIAVQQALATLDAVWRSQMFWLGLLVFAALAVACLFAKNSPDAYGMPAFGELPNADQEPEWSLRAAFSRYAIWAAILTFLTSMMAEFLIWSQLISYWTTDHGFSLAQATGIYATIGLIGIFSMPLVGRLADTVVRRVGEEALGRKIMLVTGPAIGLLACLLLFGSGRPFFAYAACVLFAVYWAIVPGGVVGYTGAVYGRKTLGKVWGLATLLVMGIGPFLGSFIGSWLKDLTGSYGAAIWYALASFALSGLLAASLPRRIKARA